MLPSILEAKFKEFPQALLDTHGKDLVVTTEDSTPSGSGTVTPSTGGAQPIAASKTGTSATSKAGSGTTKGNQTAVVLNTSTVKVSSRFMASAEDLFGLLTDESRIPMWSRAPAQV
jgi:activator of HSP90 ATPase